MRAYGVKNPTHTKASRMKNYETEIDAYQSVGALNDEPLMIQGGSAPKITND